MQSLERFDAGYKSLFREPSDNEDEGGDETNSRIGEVEAFYNHWGWITSIDAVAGGDPLKWDEVTGKNVVWFLNALSYIKDKNNMQSKLNGNT